MKRLLLFAALFVLVFHITPAKAATRYTLTRLYTIGGGIPSGSMVRSYAYGINDLGHVVGYSSDYWGATQGFIWKDGFMTGLGTLQGQPSGIISSYAYGINDFDVVVGKSTSSGTPGFQAFKWQSGTMNGLGYLGPMSGSSNLSYAYAVNDMMSSPLIVGESSSIYGNSAFMYANGMFSLNGVPYPSSAQAINNIGIVAGHGYNNGPLQAFVWNSSGSVTWLGFLGVAPSGGAYSFAYGINDAMEVVGSSTSPNGTEAYRWTSYQGMQALGDLPGSIWNSVAYGINNNHVVVGTGYTINGSEAFVWDAASGMINLNSLVDTASGWLIQEARAINNTGQIVGWGRNPFGGIEAVLLTPAGPSIIGFTPPSFTFTVNEGSLGSLSQMLGITNTGGGTMPWVANGDQSWIKVFPGSGAVNSGVYIYDPVTVDASGKQPGTYTGNVVITAPATNSPQLVPVTMNVNPYPKIAYAPSSFTFTAQTGGANPADQTLSITNVQSGILNWTVTDGAAWLTLAPQSGQQSGAVTLSANISSLSAGTYVTNITVTGNAINSPVTIPVTLTVNAPPPPTIGFSPASFNWSLPQGSTSSAAQQLSITNTGGGTMPWTAQGDQWWIMIMPATAGSVASGAYSYADVSVNPNGKAPGTYTGNVVITATGATNSPQLIPVTMIITPQIVITYPNGGETLLYNQNVTITWTANPIKIVSKTDTSYSTDAGATWKLIKSQTGLKVSCAWKVPSLKKASNQCKVKTQFKDGGNKVFAEDVSDATFTITK